MNQRALVQMPTRREFLTLIAALPFGGCMSWEDDDKGAQLYDARGNRFSRISEILFESRDNEVRRISDHFQGVFPAIDDKDPSLNLARDERVYAACVQNAAVNLSFIFGPREPNDYGEGEEIKTVARIISMKFSAAGAGAGQISVGPDATLASNAVASAIPLDGRVRWPYRVPAVSQSAAPSAYGLRSDLGGNAPPGLFIADIDLAGGVIDLTDFVKGVVMTERYAIGFEHNVAATNRLSIVWAERRVGDMERQITSTY